MVANRHPDVVVVVAQSEQGQAERRLADERARLQGVGQREQGDQKRAGKGPGEREGECPVTVAAKHQLFIPGNGKVAESGDGHLAGNLHGVCILKAPLRRAQPAL